MCVFRQATVPGTFLTITGLELVNLVSHKGAKTMFLVYVERAEVAEVYYRTSSRLYAEKVANDLRRQYAGSTFPRRIVVVESY